MGFPDPNNPRYNEVHREFIRQSLDPQAPCDTFYANRITYILAVQDKNRVMNSAIEGRGRAYLLAINHGPTLRRVKVKARRVLGKIAWDPTDHAEPDTTREFDIPGTPCKAPWYRDQPVDYWFEVVTNGTETIRCECCDNPDPLAVHFDAHAVAAPIPSAPPASADPPILLPARNPSDGGAQRRAMPFRYDILQISERQKIWDGLAACPVLGSINTRAILVSNLAKQIQKAISENAATGNACALIFKTCADFHGGVLHLIETIRAIDGDTVPFKNLVSLMQSLGPPGRSASWIDLLDLVAVLELTGATLANARSRFDVRYPGKTWLTDVSRKEPLPLHATLMHLADAEIQNDNTLPIVTFAELMADEESIQDVRKVTEVILHYHRN